MTESPSPRGVAAGEDTLELDVDSRTPTADICDTSGSGAEGGDSGVTVPPPRRAATGETPFDVGS